MIGEEVYFFEGKTVVPEGKLIDISCRLLLSTDAGTFPVHFTNLWLQSDRRVEPIRTLLVPDSYTGAFIASLLLITATDNFHLHVNGNCKRES